MMSSGSAVCDSAPDVVNWLDYGKDHYATVSWNHAPEGRAMVIAAMAGLFFASTQIFLYICIALVGFGNSNVFSIIFSQALLNEPDKQNEVSGLMIMGLFGGTVFPLAMGFAADMMGQSDSVAVMAIGAAYLMVYTFMIKSAK